MSFLVESVHVHDLFKPVNISIYVMFLCFNFFPPFSIRLSVTGLLRSCYLKSSFKYIIYDFSRLVIILYWAYIYSSIYLFQTHETIFGLFPFFFLNSCVYIYIFIFRESDLYHFYESCCVDIIIDMFNSIIVFLG